MQDKINKYLEDVLQCINEIESYFENQPKIFEQYK